ncbi:hypothetical protein DSM07_01350 [Oenococcus sp. UCMA 16435]|nr:hypothetical protein DSM07_01350 [Oenococcus sp. UCMA 16435]MDI4584086.1 hypothetical protein [Oenococcus sp. UCMA 14587]
MKKIKKPFYKKWWFWVIVVIFFIGAATGGGSSSKTSKSSNNHVKAAVSSTKKTKTVASSSSSASSSSVASAPANTAKTVDLATGNWSVGTGKDIEPGWYTITATGGSGNLQTDDGEVNAILGTTIDNDLDQVDSYRADLKSGQTLQLSGLQGIHLAAITSRIPIDSGNLSAGSYEIGYDIKPGRYTISAVQGSGNLQTDDGIVNEILGTTADASLGQVTNVTVNLIKGETLNSSLEQISLIKK